jgi:membrane protein YdbS with pleckstrin-like domain
MNYSDNRVQTLSPSQWTNALWIIAGIALFQFGIFPFLALIKVLEVYYWRYEFYERTIMERKGILSVTRREIHYYRIKSIKIDEPFWMRIFGLANVTIISSDPYHPEMMLYAVPKGLELRQLIRKNTDFWRKSEGVREWDTYRL